MRKIALEYLVETRLNIRSLNIKLGATEQIISSKNSKILAIIPVNIVIR